MYNLNRSFKTVLTFNYRCSSNNIVKKCEIFGLILKAVTAEFSDYLEFKTHVSWSDLKPEAVLGMIERQSN